VSLNLREYKVLVHRKKKNGKIKCRTVSSWAICKSDALKGAKLTLRNNEEIVSIFKTGEKL
jgi:hypothetical protein